ncbi:MAG: sulfate reduction electron transfer complex DsrMKJOP subunit DsrJ [Syntrophales bacterium]|nr:sulfate reduction electron transfer complex DsrMKJOP subunit DsrJ [Syntrophales bacterium]
MRLYDKRKIIAGIVIFMVVITFPFWFGHGKKPVVPEPSLDTPAIAALTDKRCVEDTAFMRANHMKLIVSWRDQVVREGKRYYTNKNGQTIEASLTGTCLKCHSNKDQFCDRCHDYVGAKPTCWSCHIVPGEVK